jgi:COP9 signalosome complex subunit 4
VDLNLAISELPSTFRSAAVTCAILGPAGPQRSRVLANLYRDERTTTALPVYSSSILRKMFLDQILRVSEVKEFEGQLQEHQLAKIPLDRRLVVLDDEEGGVKLVGRKGPENVLDKAVMEHNILACTKVGYFAGLSTEGADVFFDRCMTISSLTGWALCWI